MDNFAVIYSMDNFAEMVFSYGSWDVAITRFKLLADERLKVKTDAKTFHKLLQVDKGMSLKIERGIDSLHILPITHSNQDTVPVVTYQIIEEEARCPECGIEIREGGPKLGLSHLYLTEDAKMTKKEEGFLFFPLICGKCAGLEEEKEAQEVRGVDNPYLYLIQKALDKHPKGSVEPCKGEAYMDSFTVEKTGEDEHTLIFWYKVGDRALNETMIVTKEGGTYVRKDSKHT